MSPTRRPPFSRSVTTSTRRPFSRAEREPASAWPPSRRPSATPGKRPRPPLRIERVWKNYVRPLTRDFRPDDMLISLKFHALCGRDRPPGGPQSCFDFNRRARRSRPTALYLKELRNSTEVGPHISRHLAVTKVCHTRLKIPAFFKKSRFSSCTPSAKMVESAANAGRSVPGWAHGSWHHNEHTHWSTQ